MDSGSNPVQDPISASQVGGASRPDVSAFYPALTLACVFPGRDLQQETLRQSHSSWLRSSFVYNHHLLSLCILVVLLAILLYILRLRRIHQREQRQAEALNLLWAEEGEALLP